MNWRIATAIQSATLEWSCLVFEWEHDFHDPVQIFAEGPPRCTDEYLVIAIFGIQGLGLIYYLAYAVGQLSSAGSRSYGQLFF